MKMRTLFAATVLAAAVFGATAAAADSLSTGFFTYNSGRSGLYFDLTATNTLTIDDFMVNGEPGDWSVWYKAGTYAGSETDASAWTLMGSGTTSNSIDTLNVGGLTINAGQTFGIYIFDYGDGFNAGQQNYRDGNETISNADLTFQGGTGNYGGLFGIGPFNNTLADRVWSGTVDYTLGSGTPEPATWALTILGFGAAGAMLRRRKVAAAAA